MPDANWIDTVHHGLPVDLRNPVEAKRDYLAFIGRIAPEKRVDRAIRIAQMSGMKLKIAAKVDAADRDYYEEEIKPLLDAAHVEFIGEISDAQKSEFLGGAAGLLVPIDWPEPFGLVMIEAMACGTPVIAFNRGSVPEIVDDGVTGFVVEDETSAAAKVRDLGTLSREKVRRNFEERFTSRTMARNYLNVYDRLVNKQKMRPHLVSA